MLLIMTMYTVEEVETVSKIPVRDINGLAFYLRYRGENDQEPIIQ